MNYCREGYISQPLRGLGVDGRNEQPYYTTFFASVQQVNLEIKESPAVITQKMMRSSFFVDYRRLNLAILSHMYPSPRLVYFIDSVGDASEFFTVDGNCGYW